MAQNVALHMCRGCTVQSGGRSQLLETSLNMEDSTLKNKYSSVSYILDQNAYCISSNKSPGASFPALWAPDV